MDLESIFARNLELIRVAKGYTQENLALDADISRSHLANLKAGSSSSTLEMLSRIAGVLGVEPWLLLLPDLTVESVHTPQELGSKPLLDPLVLKVLKDQDSKRRLRPTEI